MLGCPIFGETQAIARTAMQQIFEQYAARERTPALNAIAILLVGVATTFAVYGVMIGIGAIPFTRGAWLIGSDIAIMGPAAFFMAALAYIIAAFGIWKLNVVGWWISLLVLLFGFVQEIPTISIAVGDQRYLSMVLSGVRIVLRVAIASYLLREDVRELFRSK